MRKTLIWTLLMAMLSLGCGRKELSPEVAQIIEAVRQQYCPDRRLAVFDVSGKIEGKDLILRGETSSPEAKDKLIRRVSQIVKNLKIKDEIILLPHPDLGEDTCGLVRISVANLRREPSYASELVTQAILGSEVRLLKKSEWWYFCQMEDGYLGWISSGSLEVGDSSLVENWRRRAKVMVISNYGVVKEKPRKNSRTVSDLVRGALLAKLHKQGGWVAVELPDRRKGYVDGKIVTDLEEWKDRRRGVEDILQTAYDFLGCPYLWGGTSSKGFDCSGFTQTVFKLNGIPLPRDANQQVEVGEEVSPGDNFENLKPGDLLFFGPSPERITHVGIYLGGLRYIHANEWVRINSFDPGDPDYSEYRRKTFRRAKRVVKAGGGP